MIPVSILVKVIQKKTFDSFITNNNVFHHWKKKCISFIETQQVRAHGLIFSLAPNSSIFYINERCVLVLIKLQHKASYFEVQKTDNFVFAWFQDYIARESKQPPTVYCKSEALHLTSNCPILLNGALLSCVFYLILS